MNRKKFSATIIFFILLNIIAGCGKNPLLKVINKEHSASESDAKQDSGGTNTSTQTVSIKNSAFTPGSLTVSKGITVTWTNNDSVAHTVTSTTGIFDSGILNSGKSFSYTFSNAGTYSYKCTLHPSMSSGSIIVQ